MKLTQAYAFSLISLAAGLALSLMHQDWGWFSRAGSLVVVAGILLTSSEILSHLHVLRQRRRYGEGWSQHDWASEAETHARGNTGDNEEMHSHGFYLLVAGTLIWGLGDLVGLLFQA